MVLFLLSSLGLAFGGCWVGEFFLVGSRKIVSLKYLSGRAKTHRSLRGGLQRLKLDACFLSLK